VPFERELIEQRSLFELLVPHHDSILSHRLNQRASTRATEDFFNEIGPKQTREPTWPMSAFGGQADITLARLDVGN
jgi:hypothetical protein